MRTHAHSYFLASEPNGRLLTARVFFSYFVCGFIEMVLTKWNSDTTSKFIALYRKQECLWKSDSLAYRDRNARNIGLRNIIEGMMLPDLTPDEVKKKIKYLRSTYMVEVNKLRKSLRSGTGTGSKYKPTLSWFREMDSFIKYLQVNRKTPSTLVFSFVFYINA